MVKLVLVASAVFALLLLLQSQQPAQAFKIIKVARVQGAAPAAAASVAAPAAPALDAGTLLKGVSSAVSTKLSLFSSLADSVVQLKRNIKQGLARSIGNKLHSLHSLHPNSVHTLFAKPPPPPPPATKTLEKGCADGGADGGAAAPADAPRSGSKGEGYTY